MEIVGGFQVLCNFLNIAHCTISLLQLEKPINCFYFEKKTNKRMYRGDVGSGGRSQSGAAVPTLGCWTEWPGELWKLPVPESRPQAFGCSCA